MTTPMPEAVCAAVAHRPGAVWLDGGTTGWSVLAWDPVEVVTDGRDWPAVGRALGRRARPTEPPFCGGVIGYLGYGAGHRVLPVPGEAPTPEPEVWLARYDGALCYHHESATWHATGALGDLASALESVPPLPSLGPGQAAQAVPGWTEAEWIDGVERILRLLRDGDCYQVNLTRVQHLRGVGADPFAIYRRLRASDAPWGAYLRLTDDVAILCNSPEQFISAKGRQITSDPIKGTFARAEDPAADDRQRQALDRSGKDLAELTMIVDLVRNDLGSVAAVGSVHCGPRRITGHPNVWHTSQQVSATLAGGLDVWHALAAAFPPGSVTGAPKVRACHRIAELEDHPRGVYCGAIGFVSDCGTAAWNVAIRTAVWHAGSARFHVGGGIVVASDPRDEWQETRDKARELARA
ncbi:MAG: para-aminobenzoate synthetase component 1, partial [Myxococcota bacterium]